jgi:hypothetical protein
LTHRVRCRSRRSRPSRPSRPFCPACPSIPFCPSGFRSGCFYWGGRVQHKPFLHPPVLVGRQLYNNAGRERSLSNLVPSFVREISVEHLKRAHVRHDKRRLGFPFELQDDRVKPLD